MNQKEDRSSTLSMLSIHEILDCKKANVLTHKLIQIVKNFPDLFLFYEFVIHSHHILGQHELNSCWGATRFSRWNSCIIPASWFLHRIEHEAEGPAGVLPINTDSSLIVLISSVVFFFGRSGFLNCFSWKRFCACFLWTREFPLQSIMQRYLTFCEVL